MNKKYKAILSSDVGSEAFLSGLCKIIRSEKNLIQEAASDSTGEYLRIVYPGVLSIAIRLGNDFKEPKQISISGENEKNRRG